MFNKMKYLKINRIVGFLLLFLIAGFSHLPKVFAACPSTPSTPYSMSLSSVNLDKNLALGSDIPGTQRTVTFSGSCQAGHAEKANDPIIACYYGSGGELTAYGFPGVYSTGIDGIGIAIKNAQGQRVQGAKPCDSRNTVLGYLSGSLGFSYPVTLSLVKTGNNNVSGTLDQSQTKFGMGVYNKCGIGACGGGNNWVGYSGNIIITARSCSVTSTNINIPLGDHKPAEFTGVGYGSAWKNFDVPIQCDANTRVFIRVDATKDASNAPGVMKLDTASNVATGLGVQVYYNGTGNPVVFGQSTEYKTSAGGTDAIKLTARYYQTAAAVTAGDANATATFTLTYQ